MRGYEAETSKRMICINSRLSLPHGGEWVDVCYLPEGAFSQDEEVRGETFLTENAIHMLLTEIGGMIGNPILDGETLRARSPTNQNLNTYTQGKKHLDRIMDQSRL